MALDASLPASTPACLPPAGAREAGSRRALRSVCPSLLSPVGAPAPHVQAAGTHALPSSQRHPPSPSLKPYQLVWPGFLPRPCCEAWLGPFPTLVLDGRQAPGYSQGDSGPQAGPTTTIFFLGSPVPSPAVGWPLCECWAHTTRPAASLTGGRAGVGGGLGRGQTGAVSSALPGLRGSWCELAGLVGGGGGGCPRSALLCACTWGFSLHHWVKFPEPQSHANKMGLFSKQGGTGSGCRLG